MDLLSQLCQNRDLRSILVTYLDYPNLCRLRRVCRQFSQYWPYIKLLDGRKKFLSHRGLRPSTIAALYQNISYFQLRYPDLPILKDLTRGNRKRLLEILATHNISSTEPAWYTLRTLEMWMAQALYLQLFRYFSSPMGRDSDWRKSDLSLRVLAKIIDSDKFFGTLMMRWEFAQTDEFSFLLFKHGGLDNEFLLARTSKTSPLRLLEEIIEQDHSVSYRWFLTQITPELKNRLVEEYGKESQEFYHHNLALIIKSDRVNIFTHIWSEGGNILLDLGSKSLTPSQLAEQLNGPDKLRFVKGEGWLRYLENLKALGITPGQRLSDYLQYFYR